MTQKQRKAITDLHAAGHAPQQIATLLGIDVGDVRRVLGTPKAAPTPKAAKLPAKPPEERRPGESLEQHRVRCKHARGEPLNDHEQYVLLTTRPVRRAPAKVKTYGAGTAIGCASIAKDDSRPLKI